jgi:plasmid maintenance system antidote protein VapI
VYKAVAKRIGNTVCIWINLQNSYTAMIRNIPKRIKKLSVEYKIEASNKII